MIQIVPPQVRPAPTDEGGTCRIRAVAPAPSPSEEARVVNPIPFKDSRHAIEPPGAAPAPAAGVPAPAAPRHASLALLAGLACVYTLYWAQAVFIPILLAVMSSYALTPLVNRLEQFRVSRALASAVLLATVVGGLGWTAYSLRDDATDLIASLPDVAQKFRQSMQRERGEGAKPPNSIDQVQQAAVELEKTAHATSAVPAASAARGVTRVQIEKAGFNVQDYLWSGTLGLAMFAGQATLVLFLTFFLLCSGDGFRRRLVRVAGPTLSEKKLTVQALDEIAAQIQRYLQVQVFTSLLVALATWLSFAWIGVQHAAVWGLVAGLLNFVPYIGSIAFTGASAAVGLMQYGNLESAALIAGVSLTLHTLSGYVLTPWLTSRTSRLNAVAVFVGVLAWGWLWGLWGLLLGVPIMMAFKAVCDRVEELKSVGELLGS
jgi:predicted PurR-regulated permease PerM